MISLLGRINNSLGLEGVISDSEYKDRWKTEKFFLRLEFYWWVMINILWYFTHLDKSKACSIGSPTRNMLIFSW